MDPLRVGVTYFLARGLAAGLQLGAVAALTRLLSPADYGEYALALVLAGVLNALAFQWLAAGTLRFGASPSVQQDVLLNTSLVLLATVASVLGTGFLIAAMIGATGWGYAVLWAALGLACAIGFYELTAHLAIARMNVRSYAILTTAKATLVFGLGVGAANANLGGAVVVWAVAVGQIVPAVLALAAARVRPRLTRLDRNLAAQLLRYGAPIQATMAANAVAAAADRMVLGWVAVPAVLGIYASAHDLAGQTMTLLMVTVNYAAYPLAVRAVDSGDSATARMQLRKSAEILLAIGMPAALGLWMMGNEIATLMLGAPFRDSAGQLIGIIALAALLTGLRAYYYDVAFHMARKTSMQAAIAWTLVAIGIPANIVLALSMGPKGCALAMLLSGACGLGLSAWVGKRYFPLPIPWVSWGKISIATIAVVGFLAAFSGSNGTSWLAFRIAGAMAVYAVMLVFLDAVGARALLRRFAALGAKQHGA